MTRLLLTPLAQVPTDVGRDTRFRIRSLNPACSPVLTTKDRLGTSFAVETSAAAAIAFALALRGADSGQMASRHQQRLMYLDQTDRIRTMYSAKRTSKRRFVLTDT